MRRRLPIRVENACQEDWSAMALRPEGRHCERCASTVIDLSRVTRSQADAIVRAHGGRVCGRVRADANGDAVFAPEPVKRGLVPVALAGLLAACSADDGATAESDIALTAEAPIDGRVGLADPMTGSFGGSLATGVMMPIGPEAPVVAAPVLVAQVDSTPVSEEDVEPTPEQRALTRRKHQRHTSTLYPPPPHHMMMGGIGSSSFD